LICHELGYVKIMDNRAVNLSFGNSNMHDAPLGPEAGLGRRAAPRVFRGVSPRAAYGAEGHVVVEVVGGQEAVADAVDEIGRKRRPVVRRRHG
jgi:hypothetical protein